MCVCFAVARANRPDLCRKFNAETDDGRDMAELSELLSEAINSIIDAKEESDIDSLFSAGGTSPSCRIFPDWMILNLSVSLWLSKEVEIMLGLPKTTEFNKRIPNKIL